MQNMFITPQHNGSTASGSVAAKPTDIYDCYLQPDNYEEEYEELDDYEADNFFESSQLHHLVHTQPIHLVNKQEIIDYMPQTQQLVVEEDQEKKAFISPMMTSRSSSMSSTFSKRTSGFKNYYDSIHEEMNSEYEDYEVFFGAKEQNKSLYSAFYSMHNPETTEAYHNDASVPRTYACEDAAIDLSSREIAEDETALETTDRSYHYSIQTSNAVPAASCVHQPTDEEIQFVKAVNLKLSRYAGYFTAGSKDQEYSDKVRFQEISYKFSKTYFQ
ncbi:hypothetical protein HG536_0B03930 [Torulaspora globosa]|uniref:Uncharacterized protein n=1 Tax=Torulaspora globosa TaxID=48254 RepID=A0A7G3ZDE3_9SACH|nr:uncharacterized protein HG536_0B03930 [Torulaspora globosa]QLL31529.1 hypothetical protein HG536_0B03930 [Torulaspora globosa]